MKLGLSTKAFKRLEPYDAKVSRTVLRGRRKGRLFLCYPTIVLGLVMGSPLLGNDLSWVLDMQKQAEQYQEDAHVLVRNSQEKIKKCLIPQLHKKPISSQKSTDTLYVFVSFSMPDPVLQALDRDVAAMGGKLVFRGLIKGSFRTTADKIKTLHVEALIDPTAFRDNAITGVPTFIQGKNRLRGNVSLAYVLKQFRGEEP